MRHATEQDLDRLEPLLSQLRKLPQLRERKRGYFSHGAHAFLHFHEDRGSFYSDVKLRGPFERMKVTDPDEQSIFLVRVKTALESNP